MTTLMCNDALCSYWALSMLYGGVKPHTVFIDVAPSRLFHHLHRGLIL